VILTSQIEKGLAKKAVIGEPVRFLGKRFGRVIDYNAETGTATFTIYKRYEKVIEPRLHADIRLTKSEPNSL
jgi:hypothetical protein